MSKPNSTSQQTGELTPSTEITYKSPPEKLQMDKYHVFWVIEQLLKEPKGIKWQDILIPFTLFIGLLLALFPTNFKDYLGQSAAFWEALVIILIVLSGIATIALFVIWCRFRLKNPPKTTDQIYNEITARMARDSQKPNIQ